MDIDKLKLIFNTVKYLKPKQILYRGYYFVRNRYVRKYDSKREVEVQHIHWENRVFNAISYKQRASFRFLNIEHTFDKIDWNFDGYGKLWTYNLNYFDFLHQEVLGKLEGIVLIKDFIKNENDLKDGLEPYPISLRGMNWIKFISLHKITHPEIDNYLYHNYLQLLDKLEYHILGNHLLENGFSLLFAAYYFKNDKFYKIGKQIIQEELEEQILDDGAHFERSPMYHQIMLHRLLDCIQLVQSNEQFNSESFLSLIKRKAADMLGFMDKICFDNGDYPQFNDAALGIVAIKEQLVSYAESLGLKRNKMPLSSSGYRKMQLNEIELIANIGQIGPSYQPGHAHADTFSFCLTDNGKPIVVDTGTSTYNIGERRDFERGTLAHNTVAYNSQNSSEVWAGFRVADRAHVLIAEESDTVLSVSHDGYRKSGVVHKRAFNFSEDSILIIDKIEGEVKKESYSSLHFHPDVKLEFNGQNLKINKNLRLSWEGFDKVSLDDYDYAPEFNKLMKAKKFLGTFKKESILKFEIIRN